MQPAYDLFSEHMVTSVLKEIPEFENEAGESEFWSEADSTEYFDWKQAEKVHFFHLKPSESAVRVTVQTLRVS